MTDPAQPISLAARRDASRGEPMATVRSLGRRGEGFVGDDAALVLALRRGDPGAPAALYDRHAPYIRRVLARVLGVDDELPEMLHETFAQALTSIASLDDPGRLRAWLVRVAVFTARGCIRRRQRRRWLGYAAPESLPEVGQSPASAELRLTVERVYAILDRMPERERVTFTLRYFEEMQLAEIADACDVSLSSAKRYLRRAEQRFQALASREPLLADWLAESPRFAKEAP